MSDPKPCPLSPCPFCGGGAVFERTGTPRYSTIVVCTECGARHESGEEWGHGRAWNTRAADPALVGNETRSVRDNAGCSEADTDNDPAPEDLADEIALRYRSALLDELAAKNAEIARLKDVSDTQHSALWAIQQWCEAYPLDIFPEPDLKKSAEVLKAAGLTIDAISAHCIRHVMRRLPEIIAPAIAIAEAEKVRG